MVTRIPMRNPKHSIQYWLFTAIVLIVTTAKGDGDMGHRVLGSVGLDAGSQPDTGVYVGDRFFYSHANQLKDKHGNRVPIDGLDIEAEANVVGSSGTYKIEDGPYITAAIAVPYARVTTKANVPATDIERLGLGDIFVEPLMVGWRQKYFDAVASYSFYAPTGQLDRKGLGQPQWAHQFSAGGTFFFDDERGWRLSALTSYNLYQKKNGIDVTRGDSVQIQGGLGGKFSKLIDFGLVGYGLLQIANNQGSDLPNGLADYREKAFGLGPELGVTIPMLRSKITARYEWDLGAVARPQGQVLVVSFSFLAWR